MSHSALFSFRNKLGYSEHVCISTSDKLLDIQQFASSLLFWQPITVCQVMSFWEKNFFVPIDMQGFTGHPVSFRATCWMCIILQLIYSQLHQSPVPLWFPLPDVVITTDATSNHWAFYFQSSGFPFSCSGTWSGSMCKVHNALQELQVVGLILHKIAFWLSGKVVALYLENNTTKTYLCNKGGTAFHFLSEKPVRILNLANKHVLL